MRKRKITALLLAGLMAGMTLTGCGSSGGADSTTGAGTTAADAAGDTSAAAETDGVGGMSPDASVEGQSLEGTVKIGVTDAEPAEGGTLVISMPSSPLTLDPVDYTTVYESHVMSNVMETLFTWNEDYTDVEPWLATDYTVSDDGLSYTINLRDDVYFQDGQYVQGRKMTAEDVKYSLERSKEESATDRVCRDFFDYVEVVSDTQVIIHMTAPAGPFISELAEIGTAIVPKEEVEGWGDDFASHIVGTGPFTLEEIVTDEHVVLAKNENYWGTKPHVDGIEFRIVSDSNQAINAVETGEVDIAMYLQGEAIQRAKDAGLLYQTASSAITYIRFNLQNGPTADPKVRQALTMAVDIDAMVPGIYQYGEATRAYQPLTAYSWAYNASYNDLVPSYDPEGAKALLAEAGYPDGFTMSLYIGSTTYRERMAQMLQYYWGEIGVTLDIHSSTMAEWSATVPDSWQDDVVNSYGVSWNSDPDPYGFVDKFFNTQTIHASSNAGGYTDEEMDKLLVEGFSLTDQEERKAIYDQIMEKVMNEYTGIYYAYECRNWAVSPKVHDARLRADNQVLVATSFNNVWLEP